ncbi:MAG: ERMES complex subunit [Phylliscum demangeonii]|nr:MAG: ERMES complex subunit [Phylliscum demangeonii]
MAFQFQWSPLTADSMFYSRAQELLTAALNKTPKPPIIVDDILVNELNLGSIPPELEILEIGDLADDRFRGIFKMCYSGDAFLTLKTRVQANPLNTYLSTKPAFTSPNPLAAASGLTIPLKITLSEIKLSAFIILVFSKQKGVTLVFRNDPLESLKVSSTFDSIPFVRDYLQKEIEGQLRCLLMDEVPAIIHRLSLRLLVPEEEIREGEKATDASKALSHRQTPIDPLATDAPGTSSLEPWGFGLDVPESSGWSHDPVNVESPSTFSQKNLGRLAALTNSHRTLSLFTPSIRDAVFRACAGASERGDGPGTNTPATLSVPSLSRSHSYCGSTASSYVISDQGSMESGYLGSSSSRPSLTSFHSAMSGLHPGAGRHSRAHAGRKKKRRVVNLRQERASSQDVDAVDSVSAAVADPIIEEREEELLTPPRSPRARPGTATGTRSRRASLEVWGSPTTNLRPSTPQRPITPLHTGSSLVHQGTQTSPDRLARVTTTQPARETAASAIPAERAALQAQVAEKTFSFLASTASSSTSTQTSDPPAVTSSGSPAWGILERAWMAKIAGEVARRVADEKDSHGRRLWPSRDDGDDHEDGDHGMDEAPPPAYAVR